jgi:tetratricopeptide (TPR) repeat protein
MESEPPPQQIESADQASHRTPSERDATGSASRWPSLRPDPLLVACFAALIAFPLTAALAASRQPIAPEPMAAAATPPAASGPTVRDVPAFTPGGQVAGAVERGKLLTDFGAMRGTLRSAMSEVFDPRERAAFESQLEDDASGAPPPDRLLDSALSAPLDEPTTAAANDLGALLVLAAARFPDQVPNAAPLGYAVLDRARAGNACLPQLNLAFLLSTNITPVDAETEKEFREAERRCPDDPTPLWLLGQFQSQRAVLDASSGFPPPVAPAQQLRRTFATFDRLQRSFPRSSAGWSGAADAHLRLAYQLRDSQHFTLRSHYRRALTLYRRARALDPDPALAAGEARAEAGLRLYAEAARSQQRALRGAPRPAQLQARLVEYLERARAFGAAAEEAGRLAASPRFPRGPALFAEQDADGGLLDEDGQDALSLGSGRVLGVQLDVLHNFGGSGGGGVAVLDVSFIPEFREVPGLAGYHRWCPSWERRRDLILAGRPEAALDALPAGFVGIRPGAEIEDCREHAAPLLAAIAELERGNGDAALRRLRSSNVDTNGRPSAYLHAARQNLWRFAGDLDRARSAADEWTSAMPASSVAFDRAGEIAFLDRDYDRAAELFAKAARLAREQNGTWSTAEATALLKQGTALELARRYAEALAVLAESDEVASRVHGLTGSPRAAYLSYSARLQMGDTYLRQHRYEAAVEHYAAARERERDLEEVRAGAAGRRPEVLDNNQALVEMRLGNAAGAVEAAKRALKADRLSPIFLQTLGLALERAREPDRALDAYRAAVREDTSLYPAWNDLGVALAGQDRLKEAADAFRHAVGVRPEYGLAWFNLGVALEKLGLEHAPAAQGAFGRAVRADSDLRGRERTFVTDSDPYFTTLDLSKPLPPKWEFARTQERAPVAVAGFAIALLLGLQLSRTLVGQSRRGEAQQWLEVTRDALGRLPRALASPAGVVAIAATVIVFLLPLLRSGEASWTSAILLVLGVGILIVIVVRSRVLIARRAGVTLRQRGWTPGILAGLVLAAIGLPWAPLPVAETSKPAAAVHWIGPVAAGAAALCLLPVAVAFEVPNTMALGSAALVMAASLLTPIEPVDGGFVAKGPVGLVACMAALATALFLLLGLS